MALPLRTRVTQKTAESNDLVQTISSTATRLTNYGKSILAHASTAAVGFQVESPIPGVRKVIVRTASGSTLVHSVTGLSTTVLFANATQTNTSLAFDAVGDLIELEGRTTLIWDVISNQNVTLS